MFRVTIYQQDLAWLAYAAGIAVGTGNAEAAASLQGILMRLEPMGMEDNPEPAEPTVLFTAEEEAINEAGGIPAPPHNPQGSFGAGPPGRSGA